MTPPLFLLSLVFSLVAIGESEDGGWGVKRSEESGGVHVGEGESMDDGGWRVKWVHERVSVMLV